jgi:ParB family chromosome partitioning protein
MRVKPNLSGIKANKDGSGMLRALSGELPPPDPMHGPAHSIVADSGGIAQMKIGQTYDVPLAVVELSENNARVKYVPAEVEDMAKSIRAHQQDVPASGYIRNNRIVVVEGGKRFHACVLGKVPTLKVHLTEPPTSDAEEYEASRRMNVERSTQSPFDDAVRWEQLLARGAYQSQEELAARLNIGTPTVSKTLGLNRIPATVQRILTEGDRPCTLAVAYEISTIFSKANADEMDQLTSIAEEVATAVVKQGLGREQTIALVKAKLTGPRRRTRGESSPIAFHDNQGVMKIVESRGEFAIAFKGLKPEHIKALKERLPSFLGDQMAM